MHMLKDNTGKRRRLGRRAAWQGCWLGALLAVLAAGGAAAAPPTEVLVLHSFGLEFAPYNTFSESFRTELGKRLDSPVEFHDVGLESARFEGEASEGPLVDYLDALFARQRLDLVVTIGGPAAHFGQKYRPRLFSTTPMLIAAVDQRLLQTVALTTNDAVVAVTHDVVRMMDSILQVLPQTTNVVVVLGNSPLEKFWLGETRRQFEPFTNRVSLAWFNKLSFPEMLKRAAALPPRSAIFYAQMSVDARGVPYVEGRALRELHDVANAPIFGLHDSQLGQGIVGGPLVAIEELGRNTAKVAVRILHGEPAGSIQTPVQGPGLPVYDWRELKRWHISEARLPMGSVIRFRQLTAWELYKWRFMGVLALCLVEALLIVLLLLNLVKRRRSEQALRDSEERLSLATAAADLGVWAWDMHNNRIWVSANWRRMFGFPPEGDIGFETVFQRVHADDREALELSVKRAVEGKADYVVEYRVVRPDATQRWITARGRLHPGRKVKHDLLLGVSVDITERKNAEQALRESEERLRLVLEANSEGVWDWDIPSGQAFFSRHYSGMLGYEPEEFAKDYDGWKALVHPDDFERVNAAHAAHIHEGKEFSVELRMRKKSDDWCWIRSRGMVVERDAEGRAIRMVGTHQDITERKQAEQELQQQREELAHVSRVSVMGELAASVAHELNQPLGAILSNAEAAELFLAQDPPAVGELRDILADIRKDDERAGEVIRRMRTLLRKGELERQPLQMNFLVEDVFRLVAANASLRTTSIRAELTPDLPLVSGDRIQLQQVLLNLIMNALEAMAKQPPEKRRVTVRTGRASDGMVEVSVTDSGPGIEPANLPRLFEPFFTTKQSGIGMGLAISRKIVEAHRGRISAENHAGGGAILRVELPGVKGGEVTSEQ
jgi:PAS domain S-box-containing protein